MSELYPATMKVIEFVADCHGVPPRLLLVETTNLPRHISIARGMCVHILAREFGLESDKIGIVFRASGAKMRYILGGYVQREMKDELVATQAKRITKALKMHLGIIPSNGL